MGRVLNSARPDRKPSGNRHPMRAPSATGGLGGNDPEFVSGRDGEASRADPTDDLRMLAAFVRDRTDLPKKEDLCNKVYTISMEIKTLPGRNRAAPAAFSGSAGAATGLSCWKMAPVRRSRWGLFFSRPERLGTSRGATGSRRTKPRRVTWRKTKN
jgi:hypothetical protein